MINNCSVSLYHYEQATEQWKRSFFPCTFVYRSFASDISNSSLSSKNYCVIRIPHHADVDINIGDYVCIGNPSFDEPDSSCFKVISYTKNNFGSSPHLKIICA